MIIHANSTPFSKTVPLPITKWTWPISAAAFLATRVQKISSFDFISLYPILLFHPQSHPESSSVDGSPHLANGLLSIQHATKSRPTRPRQKAQSCPVPDHSPTAIAVDGFPVSPAVLIIQRQMHRPTGGQQYFQSPRHSPLWVCLLFHFPNHHGGQKAGRVVNGISQMAAG